MWCQYQHKEFSLMELLDHPVLALAMTRAGMERRSVELLLEAASPEQKRELPGRLEEPILA